ncbi:DUF3306 domain-containing protein [Bosea sp. CS1GBMeth4]|uniref:DUF3306 domain-containing protein n=1 Tax=Bosea sp. CS1GBMeth4 TaxID=1892849 RepID=UPI0016450878|nr:DUF3306 domain-containing protein [Bosea sp. CS1GBMeth4]
MARGDDDKRDEGFLGRWARRKREAQNRDQPSPPLWGEGGMPPSTNVHPGSAELSAIPPSHPSLTREEGSHADPEPEMVEPPSLDLVDKDFDLAHWLKQNVPEDWKLKALRRAWESDPAIAGYQDPARDYALDWNIPGGAPGYGPLSESDNVEEMLANIFGKPAENPKAEPASAGEAVRNDAADIRPSSNEPETVDSVALQHKPGAPDEAAESPLIEGARESRNTGENPAKFESLPSGESVAPQNPAGTGSALPRQRRRGGGATPL